MIQMHMQSNELFTSNLANIKIITYIFYDSNSHVYDSNSYAIEKLFVSTLRVKICWWEV